jgi:hypothetical protein
MSSNWRIPTLDECPPVGFENDGASTKHASISANVARSPAPSFAAVRSTRFAFRI